MNTPPAISQYLAVTLGIAEEATGKGTISRAITAAMQQEGVSDLQAYERLFVSSGAVRQRLIDAVVVGETWFFRDRGPFTYLARHARELYDSKVLRILSAPCATGEEPYSIAMTLLAAGIPPSAFTVDGVDISTLALAKARLACYRSGAFRGHIGEDVSRFFEETPNGRKVSGQVTRQVTFLPDNLVSKESLIGRGPYKIIFCRNLLIYLTGDARRQVFERLDRLLLPGGLLFTGHTETIFWHQQGYLPLKWERAFALTKPLTTAAPEASATSKNLKSTLSPDAKRQELKPPTASGRPSGSKRLDETTLADSPSLPTAVKNEQPVNPVMTSAKAPGAEQIQEARRLADLGDMESAVRLCQEYTRTIGPSAETYSLMGVIHMARQDMNAALDFFLKALYLDPGHYESLVHISLLYRQKGDERKAALYRERAERKADTGKKQLNDVSTNG